ncbi:MAG: hypothetical protein CMM98_02195 [Rickettsiales bacterium]|nr:hypothetical protein [Rickettsiales bacterium]
MNNQLIKNIGTGPALIFVLIPYFFILIIGLLGYSVDTRDLDEYIKQIENFEYAFPSIDFLSWSFLNFALGELQLNQNIIRIFTFIFYLSTCFIIYLFSSDRNGLYLFVVSTGFLLPVLLLSQIRLLIAICFFASVLSIFRSKFFATLAGSFSHFSFFLLFFFPAIFALGFIIELVLLLPFNIPGFIRIESYFLLAKSLESGNSPIYFGWELIVLSSIYLYSKSYRVSLYIFLSFIGILYLHHASGLSTDAARRLIELCIFAYSPFVVFVVPHLSNKVLIEKLPKFLTIFMWGLFFLQNYKLVELVLIS